MDSQKRINSIDIVRGLVMVIMALDHLRDLLHTTALTQSPTDLTTTTPELFFTRWITHLCAPIFVFLAGTSAYISYQRSKDKSANKNLLWKRGIWLIVLEFTIINFLIWFDFDFRLLMLQVIAAIGVGFILLSFLVKLNPIKIGVAGLIIIVFNQLMLGLPGTNSSTVNFLISLLSRPGLHSSQPDFMFLVAYPLLPWISILLIGFAAGKIFEKPLEWQTKIFLRIGAVLLLLFFVIRAVNEYGDPSHWKAGKNTVFTILSFFNVSKQPPSLAFTLLFLGIMFLALYFSNKMPSVVQKILSVYGRVPLFYYLLHWVFVRIALFIMVFTQGFQWRDLLFGPFQFGRPAAPSGISLAAVYAVWILVVILLYPLCKWFGKYKTANTHKWWLRYL